MKKVITKKISLNKQTVTNLSALKGGKVVATYWCSGYNTCRPTDKITCNAFTCVYTCNQTDGCETVASKCYCG